MRTTVCSVVNVNYHEENIYLYLIHFFLIYISLNVKLKKSYYRWNVKMKLFDITHNISINIIPIFEKR